MQIALLTIWHEKNYGAELQAYATIKILQKLGYDVRMIDIRLSDMYKLSVKGFIAKCITWFSPSHRKFNKFWKKYIPCTKRYRSIKELKADPPIADVYIVGSDQVWNPDITKDFAPAFFLDFGADNIRRISFSSSFGVNEWKWLDDLSTIAKKQLRQFYAISSREQTGVKILKKTFGIANADNTLDPTLMFDDYSDITGPLSDKNTVVCYPLSSNDYALLPVADKVAGILSAQTKNANPYILIPHTSLVWDRNTISEWMRTIAEARFVLTQSFHGMVFSILHHRQFAIINLSKHGRQSRILDLLLALGLEDRYFTSEKDFLQSNIINKVIDYATVDSKLQTLRSLSWDYLKRATK